MELNTREQGIKVSQEKAILVACLLPNDGLNPHDPLGELASLAKTAGAIVVDSLMQKRRKPSAKMFIGKGKVQELAEMVKTHEATCIIFENDLSPSQIGRIEAEVNCQVLDRTELILDIFAMRAQTLEARLQIEFAQLIYTYPRLTNMWTHLERQEGAIGTRGPGETQLETDRRIVQRKKAQLRREIAVIQERKAREVASRNQGHFTVGLVGYTNAGKSTLFNTLTDAAAYADNKLFATLSTLTRKWKLGGGEDILLSDTVGFVRNLPHLLVASFKATLEEATHADLLLIVVDAMDPEAAKHLKVVREVLDEIGADKVPYKILLNKMDGLTSNAELLLLAEQYDDALPISAITGQGLDQLINWVRPQAEGRARTMDMQVPFSDGKTMQYLEQRVPILERTYQADHVVLKLTIGQRQLEKLQAMGTKATWAGKDNTAAREKGWGEG